MMNCHKIKIIKFESRLKVINMRSYKRYTRRKRLLKHIVVVALVFILGLVLLRVVSYIAIQGEIPMINSFNLFRREADTSFGWILP